MHTYMHTYLFFQIIYMDPPNPLTSNMLNTTKMFLLGRGLSHFWRYHIPHMYMSYVFHVFYVYIYIHVYIYIYHYIYICWTCLSAFTPDVFVAAKATRLGTEPGPRSGRQRREWGESLLFPGHAAARAHGLHRHTNTTCNTSRMKRSNKM